MPQATSRTYVLVHGAWHGGWVWKDVAPALRAMGHNVSTPSMTGLGERRHLAAFPYDLETHVTDICQHIEMERLHDIDLVGWSYGGMVTTGVLARMQNRVRSMIYLDAFMPQDGKAVVDYVEGPARDAMEAARRDQKPMAPIPLQVFGVTDPVVIAFAQPRLAEQAWKCFCQPVKALAQRPDNIPYSYVRCTGFDPSPFSYFLEQARKDPLFTTHVMDTSHLCMLTEPAGTLEILSKAK